MTERDNKRRLKSVGGVETGSTSISFDPKNLVLSLGSVLLRVPDGISYWDVNSSGSALTPLQPTSSVWNLPEGAVGITRQRIMYSGEEEIQIREAGSTEFPSSDSTDLSFIYRDGRMTDCRFHDGMHFSPHASVLFSTDGRGLKSQGNVYLSLVPSCAGLNLQYAGNGKQLRFTNLEDLVTGQLALLFKDGKVPVVDIQRYIASSIFGLARRRRERETVAVPELTFDRQRHDFVVGHGYAYVSECKFSGSARFVSGVVMDESGRHPYRVGVKVEDMAERPYLYTYGYGMATAIAGRTTIDNGLGKKAQTDAPFIVNSDIAYLARHPEHALGQAYADFKKILFG